MSPELSTLPVSGTSVLAAAAYAALSAFVIGPEIASREIARSNWTQTCQTALQAEIEATRRPPRMIPTVPNLGGVICSVYPELNDVCAMLPDPNAPAREAEKRARQAEEARIRTAVAGTADQCSCAEAVYKEEHRLSLALYTSSGRLINQAIKDRENALTRALHSPACSLGREG